LLNRGNGKLREFSGGRGSPLEVSLQDGGGVTINECRGGDDPIGSEQSKVTQPEPKSCKEAFTMSHILSNIADCPPGSERTGIEP